MEPRIDAGVFEDEQQTPDLHPTPPPKPKAPRVKPRSGLAASKASPLGPLSLVLAGTALLLSLWNLWSSPTVPPAAGPQGGSAALTADQAARLEKRVMALEHLIASPPPGKSAAASDRTQAARVEKMKLDIDALYQRIVGLEHRVAGTRKPRPAPAATAAAAAPAAPVKTAAGVLALSTGGPAVTRATPAPAVKRKPAKPTRKRVVYKVRRGDSLTVIARRHGVSVKSIRAWNPRVNSNIKPGQKIVVYVKRR